MLGWNMYFKDIDKTIVTFLDYEKDDPSRTKLPEAKEFKDKYMKTKTIMQEINEAGQYKGYGLYPFGNDSYADVDEMLERI